MGPDGGRDLSLPGRASREIFGGGNGASSTVRRVHIPSDTARARGFHVHHGCEEIILVVKGSGHMHVPESATPIQEGDIIRVPPDLPHMTVPHEGTELDLLCFFPHADISAVTEEWRVQP